jgi:hypothetical protein
MNDVKVFAFRISTVTTIIKRRSWCRLPIQSFISRISFISSILFHTLAQTTPFEYPPVQTLKSEHGSHRPRVHTQQRIPTAQAPTACSLVTHSQERDWPGPSCYTSTPFRCLSIPFRILEKQPCLARKNSHTALRHSLILTPGRLLVLVCCVLLAAPFWACHGGLIELPSPNAWDTPLSPHHRSRDIHPSRTWRNHGIDRSISIPAGCGAIMASTVLYPSQQDVAQSWHRPFYGMASRRRRRARRLSG